MQSAASFPTHYHRRRIKTEEKAKVVAAVWGTELIQFLAALAISRKDVLKKRMNRKKATWWNECFEEMDDRPVHINQTTTLPKSMFSQKLFFKSSLLLND